MNVTQKVKKTILLCLILAVSTCLPSLFFAQTSMNTPVVRVGWYHSNHFQEGMSDDEPKWGYSYTYLQVVASYAGWKYEYVYGEWPELLEMLRNGQIDMMAGVSDTPERRTYLSYPYWSMGKEAYSLYQTENNRSMNIADKKTFHGQTIGAITDNLMTWYLEQWIAENNLDLHIVCYNTFEERDAALLDGKIDGAVATDNNILSNSGYAFITNVGASPYYLAVTKSRQDLLLQLNDALALLEEMDPYFLQNLEYASYCLTLKNTTLTDLEKKWLSQHDSLTIGYLDDYLPFCDVDEEGQIREMLVDVMNAIEANLNISDRLAIRYVPYENYETLVQSLADGVVDVIFPAGGSVWQMEKDGLMASHSVVSAGMDLVYKGRYEKAEDGIFAVNRNNKLHYYFVHDTFPKATIQLYDSIEAVLDAVNDGKADCTIINGLRIELVNNNRKYDSLSVTQLQKTANRYFGLKKENAALLLLLNRGLKLIGTDFGANASYSYINQNRMETLGDLLRRNLGSVLILIAGFVLMLIIVFYSYVLAITKARRRTEEASRAKTAFLSNMSHDIRTPMNAILGFADIMERKKEDPETVSQYIKKIRISGEYLLSIINNVLDMAKIESGKATVDESVRDLLSEDNTIFSDIQELARKKNQTFTVENNVVHRYVMVDGPKLQEIMMNLLSNAVKYTPEGGVIQVVMDELPCEKPGYGTYRVVVKDNGVGMSREYQEYLFDPFTRERNTTQSKVIGTGLGMSIVKKLVDLMSGTIDVESEPGKGTTFTLTFDHKIAECPGQPQKQTETELIPEDFAHGKRILLAEDNEFNAEIAVELLEEAGFAVEVAKDGVECVNMLVSNRTQYYDLILMDIQMPNLGGYDATRLIRGLDDTQKAGIPIIAMTADAFEEDRQKAYDAGMDGHIAKPVNYTILMETLGGILGES